MSRSKAEKMTKKQLAGKYVEIMKGDRRLGVEEMEIKKRRWQYGSVSH